MSTTVRRRTAALLAVAGCALAVVPATASAEIPCPKGDFCLRDYYGGTTHHIWYWSGSQRSFAGEKFSGTNIPVRGHAGVASNNGYAVKGKGDVLVSLDNGERHCVRRGTSFIYPRLSTIRSYVWTDC